MAGIPAGPYREPPPLLEDPPRKVPRSVAVRVRFGGPLAQFGWLFLAGSLFTFFAFLGSTDFGGSDGASAPGTVTATTASIKRGRPNSWRIEYRFVDEAGRNHHGRSYAERPIAVGRPVAVVYAPGRPERSHIEGMRSSPMTP